MSNTKAANIAPNAALTAELVLQGTIKAFNRDHVLMPESFTETVNLGAAERELTIKQGAVTATLSLALGLVTTPADPASGLAEDQLVTITGSIKASAHLLFEDVTILDQTVGETLDLSQPLVRTWRGPHGSLTATVRLSVTETPAAAAPAAPIVLQEAA